MDIPLNTEVVCADGPCGRSTYVVIRPDRQEVTHVVVAENDWSRTLHLVPMSEVLETTPVMIRLRCTRLDLARFEPFAEIKFVPLLDPAHSDYAGSSYMMPAEPWVMPLEERSSSAKGLAIRRGTRVYAKDGRVGRVDEFLVDPTDGHVTHIVLLKGHLWGERDVTIPVSEIESIDEKSVHLKLDKRSIESLPEVPPPKKVA